MKKLASLILAGLLTVAMIAPVAADSTDILKGTPEIDGVLDEIYLQSASQALQNPAFYAWGDSGEADMDATSYFLWDDNYLYVCTVVTDDDVVDVGAACYEANPTNWQADAVEAWYNEGNGIFKSHADAYGNTFFVQANPGEPTFTNADLKSAAELTDDGYIIEYAMPFANLGDGETFSFSLQVNDISTEDHANGYASGLQTADIEMTMSGTEVTYPEPETEAPVVDEVVEVTAPATFDAGIIAAVAAIVSAAGYAISKKR